MAFLFRCGQCRGNGVQISANPSLLNLCEQDGHPFVCHNNYKLIPLFGGRDSESFSSARKAICRIVSSKAMKVWVFLCLMLVRLSVLLRAVYAVFFLMFVLPFYIAIQARILLRNPNTKTLTNAIALAFFFVL